MDTLEEMLIDEAVVYRDEQQNQASPYAKVDAPPPALEREPR